jgi:hypothetical protein
MGVCSQVEMQMDCFVVRVNHATMNVYRVRESSVEIRDNTEALIDEWRKLIL